MKKTKIFLLSLIIWYIIGVFISGYFNPMNWINIGKIIYLILVFAAYEKVLEDY